MNRARQNIGRDEILGVVLCGGESLRFGSLKPFHVFEGATLVERAMNLIRPFVSEICLAVGESLDLEWPDAMRVPDLTRGIGPIAGIQAAARRSEKEWLLTLPVDVPFMTTDAVSTLIYEARDGDTAVVAADGLGDIHPLCAIYHRSVLPVIEGAIERKQFGLQRLLSSLNSVRYVTLPDGCLHNANRPEDLI